MDSRARELIRIGSGLFSKKSMWDSLAQEIAEHFHPMRSDFTQSFSLGTDFATGLMDSYPVQARETLGNMPNAMLRQGDWFKVGTGEEDIDEDKLNAEWLEYATKSYRKLVYDRRALFVKATVESDHDYVTFGNGVLSVEESPTRDHLLYRAWHPKLCAWMENEAGQIDHLQRKAPMTARAMARRWAKNLHSGIRQAVEKDPTKEFSVRHIVLPVDEIYGDDRKAMRRYRDMPFVSIYVDCDHELILGEGPLPVFNYVVPRWRTVSGFPQGFSPATINSLPDGRSLQVLARIILEQGEKAVDPPVIGKGDIFRDAVNLYAGGMTFVDLEDADDIRKVFQTVDTGGNLNIGAEMKADTRNLIAEAFLLNKLMLPNTREMTAYETQARLEEFRRAALPFFGPIESEYHLPLLDIGFQIALRNGAFDLRDMPDALAGQEITFTFDTPLNTVEGRQNVQAFMESVQIIAAAAQFDQTIPQRWNLPKMVDDAVRGAGAPSDWEVDEEVKAEAEEQQRTVAGLQKAAAMLQGGAQVGKDVAEATVALEQAGLA